LQGRGHLQHTQDRSALERAVTTFQEALQRDPNYALAYAGLCEAQWRMYELTKDRVSVEVARKACERAVAINDLLAPVHVTLGLLHVGTGQAEEALADFDRALALDPASSEARRGKAEAHTALGNVDAAVAEYRKAIALKPDYWWNHASFGRFLFRRGRYQEAEQAYRRVIQLVPDSEFGHASLGTVLLAMGRFDEGVVALNRSLSIRPTFIVQSNLATAEFRRGRLREAARAFEKALALDDRDYRLWRNLGAAYYWVPGERDKAPAAYRKAVELAEAARAVNPKSGELNMDLADCYAMLGEAAKARALAAEVLARSASDVQVIQRAVGVYESLGDRDAALRWLAEALKLGYPRENFERSHTLASLREDARYTALVESRDRNNERTERRR
jgi:tetratricopeptide (TPR) repeat protein